jgi:outer membrane protein OmpA-like peptidoglycan-associated protein
MDQETQNSIPDEPPAEPKVARSPWRRSSDNNPVGAQPAAPKSAPNAASSQSTESVPAADGVQPGNRSEPLTTPNMTEPVGNPLFGSGIRRVIKPPIDSARSNDNTDSPSPAAPSRGGFKLGRMTDDAAPAKPVVDEPSPPKPGSPAPELPKRRVFDMDSVADDVDAGLSAAHPPARRTFGGSADASTTFGADADNDGLSGPQKPKRITLASSEDGVTPPKAQRTSAGLDDGAAKSPGLRPPKGLRLPDSVKAATAASLNPDEANAGLSASGLATKDNKFSFHRRFTKVGWAAIIASQLVLATGLVVGVRRYFGVGQSEAPAAPLSPIIIATQTAEARAVQAAKPAVTIVAVAATAAPVTSAPVAAATSAPKTTAVVGVAVVAPTTAAAVAAAPVDFEAKAVAGSTGPSPFFGPSYSATDGKPVYVCAAQPDASALALLHIQMAGLDVANGFHLGIVPLGFDASNYSVVMADQAQALQSKQWDCLFANVDEAAQRDLGVVTAIVDENVGGYGIWSRGGQRSYEDLRDKKIGYVRDSSSQYFTRYVLGIMTQDVRASVKLQAFDTMDAALDAFSTSGVDAVALPDSFLRVRGVRGARAVIDSAQLRVIVGSVVTSRAAIAKQPELVKNFHNAYFGALKLQLDDVEASASRIANWGNSAWSGVNRKGAAGDLRQMLSLSAQATAAQNAALAQDGAPLASVLNGSRALYLSAFRDAAQPVPAQLPEITALVDLSYASAAGAAATTAAQPLNASFSLRANVPEAANAAATASQGGAESTVAVLPCRKFTFEPDSAKLTDESRSVLDLCVAPALKQRIGVFLLVRGSAAWPGPKGTYSETQIRDIANSRAKAITEYLISQKIDPTRFKIESVVPPAERRDTDDPIKQAEDRWVEMSLIASGR